MTMPHERTRSVIHTRDFLIELSRNISIPESIRRDAKFLLRHYPTKEDMLTASRIEESTNSLPGLMGPVFSSPFDD